MDWIYTATNFYSPSMLIAAGVAVAFVGLGKGGLSGFGLLGVPILAIYMPPLQAAAILLPSYLIMDATALLAWRGYRDGSLLKAMLPSAILGIGIGAIFASLISDQFIKLFIGVLAIGFLTGQWIAYWHKRNEAKRPDARRARFWGAISGFTSFLAHAGGPPFQIYTLPLQLDPKILTGSATIFFAVVNIAKIFPYFFLGQFDSKIGSSTLILLPIVVSFVLIGAAIVKRMKPSVFYPFMYVMLGLTALKLIFDALTS